MSNSATRTTAARRMTATKAVSPGGRRCVQSVERGPDASRWVPVYRLRLTGLCPRRPPLGSAAEGK